MGDVGFPIWYDEKDLITFVKEAEFQAGLIFLIKHDKGTKQRRLIQVYGIKAGETEKKTMNIENEEWKDY